MFDTMDMLILLMGGVTHLVQVLLTSKCPPLDDVMGRGDVLTTMKIGLSLKGKVHLKMKILSSCTWPQILSNLCKQEKDDLF